MADTLEDYEALVRDQLTQLGYDASVIPDDVLRQFLRDFDDKIGLDEPADDGESALCYPTALEESESLGGQWRTGAAVSYTTASCLPAAEASPPCACGAFDAAGLEFGSDDGRGGASYGLTHAAAAAALAGGLELSGWGDEDLLSTTMAARQPTGPARGLGRPSSLAPSAPSPSYGCARRATDAPAPCSAPPLSSHSVSGCGEALKGAHAARHALGEAAPSSANARGCGAARRTGSAPDHAAFSPAFGSFPTCGHLSGGGGVAGTDDQISAGGEHAAAYRPTRADARPATAPPAPRASSSAPRSPPGGWCDARPASRSALGSVSGIPTPRSAAHGGNGASSWAVIRRVDGTPRRSKQDPVSNYHRHVSGWKGNGFLSHQSPHARSTPCAASPAPPTREAARRRPPSNFVVPTSKRRDDVVWETRLRMKAMRDGLHASASGGPATPRRARRHSPNAFVVPTDKRRDSLRWRVRADMAYAH